MVEIVTVAGELTVFARANECVFSIFLRLHELASDANECNRENIEKPLLPSAKTAVLLTTGTHFSQIPPPGVKEPELVKFTEVSLALAEAGTEH